MPKNCANIKILKIFIYLQQINHAEINLDQELHESVWFKPSFYIWRPYDYLRYLTTFKGTTSQDGDFNVLLNCFINRFDCIFHTIIFHSSVVKLSGLWTTEYEFKSALGFCSHLLNEIKKKNYPKLHIFFPHIWLIYF